MTDHKSYTGQLGDLQVVVLMGGLGTRLKEYTVTCPKSLVEVDGHPFFDYELKLLKEAGFKKFLFLIGYKADMIEEYYGDGKDQGISITYCYDGEELLGTGGAIKRALDLLEEDFLVTYGDSFMDIDYEETVYRYFAGKASGKRALMTILKNNNSFDKSNVVAKDGQIILYDKKNTVPEMEYIDYGVCVYERSLFEEYDGDRRFDVAIIQNELSKKGQLAAHEVTRRFYEIGSPKALSEFREYVNKRFNTENRAVFLDRDGVINEIVYNDDTEQLDSPQKKEDFRLLPGVSEALRIFKEKGYLIFIVTNQPGAAKGKSKLSVLYDINTSFVNSMKAEGIEIEGVYMCPHYPKMQPYTKEAFLIKDCDCRKPKPGLIMKAVKKYNIDTASSYMIGDSISDILAGKAAGVKTVFIGDLKCDACKKLCDKEPNLTASDILKAAQAVE
ncbi:MAG: HAD-IIIA family hydrolase [Lachnospiraceae bacterium]|nr:HAD-IIIA family hydrolase [Lachnospiraceae bacterium]